jgi:hypothetical protein
VWVCFAPSASRFYSVDITIFCDLNNVPQPSFTWKRLLSQGLYGEARMTIFEEEEYKEFKGKFLDQKLNKALIEESTEVLRKKNDEWISAFRIRLSKVK